MEALGTVTVAVLLAALYGVIAALITYAIMWVINKYYTSFDNPEQVAKTVGIITAALTLISSLNT